MLFVISQIMGPQWCLFSSMGYCLGRCCRSVSVLRELDPNLRGIARSVYFDALRLAFLTSYSVGSRCAICGIFARGKRLDRN